MSVYQIHFRVEEELTTRIGRLGRCRFPPGCYFYTGSARRGLEARLRRHLSRRKKRRWHIDYVLGRTGVAVDFILVCEAEAVGGECGMHQRALAALGALTPVPRFGSSDCRGGCPSHLGRLKRAVSTRSVLARLGLEKRGTVDLFPSRVIGRPSKHTTK